MPRQPQGVEQRGHNQPVEVKEFLIVTGRDMMENWQSEFLQLIWQVGGLAFLLCVGSPQSREGEERNEAKLEWLMRRIGGPDGEREIQELEKKFPKK